VLATPRPPRSRCSSSRTTGDTHRFEVIAALVIVYGALAAFAFLRVGAIIRRQPTPFAATIAELEKDRRWLAGGPPPTP
jgi:uncharacterized membrane protein YqjE